jgi:hypothetical protein
MTSFWDIVKQENPDQLTPMGCHLDRPSLQSVVDSFYVNPIGFDVDIWSGRFKDNPEVNTVGRRVRIAGFFRLVFFPGCVLARGVDLQEGQVCTQDEGEVASAIGVFSGFHKVELDGPVLVARFAGALSVVSHIVTDEYSEYDMTPLPEGVGITLEPSKSGCPYEAFVIGDHE